MTAQPITMGASTTTGATLGQFRRDLLDAGIHQTVADELVLRAGSYLFDPMNGFGLVVSAPVEVTA